MAKHRPRDTYAQPSLLQSAAVFTFLLGLPGGAAALMLLHALAHATGATLPGWAGEAAFLVGAVTGLAAALSAEDRGGRTTVSQSASAR